MRSASAASIGPGDGDELDRLGDADDPREQPRHRVVGGEADAAERRGEAGVVGAEPDVAAQREPEATAGGHAVDRADQWLAELEQGQEEVARHRHRRDLPAARREVDAAEVGTGAERVTRTGEQDDPHVVVVLRLRAQLRDVVHVVGRHRVAVVRAGSAGCAAGGRAGSPRCRRSTRRARATSCSGGVGARSRIARDCSRSRPITGTSASCSGSGCSRRRLCLFTSAAIAAILNRAWASNHSRSATGGAGRVLVGAEQLGAGRHPRRCRTDRRRLLVGVDVREEPAQVDARVLPGPELPVDDRGHRRRPGPAGCRGGTRRGRRSTASARAAARAVPSPAPGTRRGGRRARSRRCAAHRSTSSTSVTSGSSAQTDGAGRDRVQAGRAPAPPRAAGRGSSPAAGARRARRAAARTTRPRRSPSRRAVAPPVAHPASVKQHRRDRRAPGPDDRLLHARLAQHVAVARRRQPRWRHLHHDRRAGVRGRRGR